MRHKHDMRTKTVLLSFALALLAPAVALASFPVDVYIPLSEGVDAAVGVERPTQAPSVRLSLAEDGERCSVVLTLSEAEDVADMLVDAAVEGNGSTFLPASGGIVRASFEASFENVHVEVSNAGCDRIIVVGGEAEIHDVVDALNEAAA